MTNSRSASVVFIALAHISLIMGQAPVRAVRQDPTKVQPITIRIDAPARLGFPIWIHADLQGWLTARYPYAEDPRYLGSNQLELKRDGTLLAPERGAGMGGQGPGGLTVGSMAPSSSPQNRLPLHLAFAIKDPGKYSVRWRVVGETMDRAHTPILLAQSEWVDFQVLATRVTDRELWLASTLRFEPPRTDRGVYVGNYLPSLLAAVPDRRVARVLIDATYAETARDSSLGMNVIVSYALGGLRSFPARVVVPLVMESFARRGSSEALAFLTSWQSSWFEDRREEVVKFALAALASKDDAAVAGSLHLLGFAQMFDWPGNRAALQANRALIVAAPSLL